MLEAGDKISTKIRVFDEADKLVTLKKYLNQPLILYFYPKDFTPGCTLEAKNFKVLHSELRKLGYNLIGVSKDSTESHRKFKQKHDLNFDLLSDPDHKLQEAFGVWQEKRMFGKSYMDTVRSTFLVDKTGEILKVWARVSPKDHAKKVLSFLQAL